MKDIPVPTLGLSQIHLPRGSLHPVLQAPAQTLPTASSASAEKAHLNVVWASHIDQVRQAQRLRHAIFAQEMGAKLHTCLPLHDVDRFDDFCEHLLVQDQTTGLTVGTYRLLTPVQAKRAGGLYTETEFEVRALESLKPHMVELGRSCVHPDYRHGAVIMALWGALAQFMQRNQLSHMVGCASIPMLHQGRVSGDAAASIWRQVSQTHLADPAWQVQAHAPLPIAQFDTQVVAEPPALIKGYLRLGARVLGAPAWDPDFNTADLPMMLRIEDMPSRYRKHFLRA
jgi:putative hemolysin